MGEHNNNLRVVIDNESKNVEGEIVDRTTMITTRRMPDGRLKRSKIAANLSVGDWVLAYPAQRSISFSVDLGHKLMARQVRNHELTKIDVILRFEDNPNEWLRYPHMLELELTTQPESQAKSANGRQ